MNSSSRAHNLNFFAALIGLFLTPLATITKLLEAKKYHFAILMVGLLLVVVFAPFAIRLYTQKHSMYRLDVLQSFVLATTIAFFLFILFEYLFLRVMGVKPHIPGFISVVCFSLAPIIIMILMIYTLNFWASGSAQYLSFFLNGHATLSPACVNAAFWVKTVCCILSGIVFMYGIKICGNNLFTSNALIITLFSAAPLFAAFFLSIVMADFIIPGTANIYRQLITTPTYLLNV
ncbi:MAG: hypothetical protein GX589_03610 [Deltaproteobacteria bacterium]|nr:hypothetical protein [Deltaproteobacteria bacterium]